MPSRAFATVVRAAAALLVCALLVVPAAPAAAASDSSVVKALDYLHARQNADGGFAEKGYASSEALTAWAVCAIASAGEDPNAWTRNGTSPLQYLSRQSGKWSATTDYARTVLAAVAGGKDPRSFGGVDLVAKIRSAAQDRGSAGVQFGPAINSHAWSMIALKAAGESPGAGSVTWLLGQQNSDGGWGWAPGVTSDSNDTAAAVQALIAAGADAQSSGVANALSYLRARQDSDGGFAYATGAHTDADSTAWVAQSVVAAGQSPASWTAKGRDPLAALRALQASDGSVRYTTSRATTPLFTTVQAIPALCGRPFPIARGPVGVASAWRPVISPRYPAAGASLAATGAVLTFAVSDGSGTGVASGGVKVAVDGKALRVSASGDTFRVPLGTLALGTHTIAVTATDRAGNAASLSGWKFVATTASAAAAASLATATPGAIAAAARVATTSAAGAGGQAAVGASQPVAPAGASHAPAPASQAVSDGGRLGLWVGGIGLLAAIAIAGTIGYLRFRGVR